MKTFDKNMAEAVTEGVSSDFDCEMTIYFTL